MSDLPTGTLTFVFAGVEAPADLRQKMGAAFDETMSGAYELVSENLSDGGGIAMPTEGDSLFVVFPTARRAVDGAVAAQRALSEKAPDLSVRIGIHTGEARVVGGDYRGIDVHRAARVASAAHGGQILVTDPTRLLAESASGETAYFLDVGEHRLKDLENPEHLYQVGAPGLRADFPPPRSMQSRPTNLTTPPSTFIPRYKELGDIKQMVKINRLVTLTGPGGTGKTRLALETAAELREHFDDGVFVVFLAGLADPNLVPANIAQALGLRQQGLTPIGDTVKDHLAGKQMLLYLDNFEHLLPAAGYVAELLDATTDLKILVTSRAALRLASEQEYPVPSMTIPLAEDVTAEALADSEAVELFVQRARLVQPDFQLTDENGRAVAQICRKLDGLPLAIELAAARIRLLDPQDLANRLDNSLALLTGGARDLPARQQTLRNTIKWSYDLLDHREQSLFYKLGVFAGGFTLEAAEALSGSDLVDELEHLVEQSLLKAEFKGSGTRYWTLEPVRQFANELIDRSPAAAQIRESHAAHFAELATTAQPLLQGPQQLEWLSRLDDENDNLRAAMAWALGAGRADIGAKLGWGLWMFWWLHGHQEEGRKAMEAFLEKELDDPDRCIIVGIAGAMALVQGDHRRSIEYMKECIALARQLQDYPRLAFGLHTLGLASLNEPDLETAQASFEEALPMFLMAGDKLMVSGIRTHIGTVALIKGDLDGAEASMSEALVLARELGDNVSTYFALYNLAQVALSREDFEKAGPLLAEGLALAGEVQDQTNLAYYLEGWAIVLGHRGEAEMSARLIGASLHLREEAAVAEYNYLTPSRPLYERTVDAVKARLGEARFDEAQKEGRAMTLRQAVAYALEAAR
ncbi:MAG TPA: AAA family ATPase [Actinomycetota bacterium]|nr:AAA family ATPase [Actinomycetota bacterium]